jgi:hypothetical protein
MEQHSGEKIFFGALIGAIVFGLVLPAVSNDNRLCAEKWHEVVDRWDSLSLADFLYWLVPTFWDKVGALFGSLIGGIASRDKKTLCGAIVGAILIGLLPMPGSAHHSGAVPWFQFWNTAFVKLGAWLGASVCYKS